MEEKIIQIANDVFDCEITSSSKIGDPQVWDSLGQLTFFMSLESQLGIKFSPEEIIENNSIKDIMNLINNKKSL